jgi:regulatory protein
VPAARARAVGLLARREYPRALLEARLTGAGFAAAAAAAALDGLEREWLLNDARYAEAAVASRSARGLGPLRIALELKRQGVAAELIDAAVDARAREWDARAAAVRRRQFGAAQPRNATERARIARFLLYRGFSGRQVSAALGAAGRDEFADLELTDDGAEPGG